MSGAMPPPELQLQYSVRPMTEVELDKVKRWIAEGAPKGPERETLAVDGAEDPLVSDDERQFWSFLPPVRPETPKVRSQVQVKSPVDAFLLAKLDEKGLEYSPQAERVALLRLSLIHI